MTRDASCSLATRALLAHVRLLVLDVDGVLTDGRLFVGAQGETTKCFHARDGLGIKMLMAGGVEVAVISARDSEMVRYRLGELGVRRMKLGRADKRAAFEELVEETAVMAAHVAYLGDDLLDLPAMSQAGVAMAVADAHPMVLARAAWISSSEGGEGAVRDACEALLASAQDFTAFVERYLVGLESGPGRRRGAA